MIFLMNFINHYLKNLLNENVYMAHKTYHIKHCVFTAQDVHST